MWEGICHMARYYACSICFRELLHCNLLAASDVEAFFPLGIGYATAAEVVETFFSYSSLAKQMQYSHLYIIMFLHRCHSVSLQQFESYGEDGIARAQLRSLGVDVEAAV